jgi:glutamate/aspartate transport system substrate-binding protein
MKKQLAFAAAALILCGNVLAQDTLGRIKSTKQINVAYSPDSLPFSFTETNGEAMGYSIDLCKRVIAQLERSTGVAGLKVNWIPAGTPQRLQMVASGKADLECGNTTQTLARMSNVDFSGLIFLDSGGFIGRAEDTSMQRITDMGGKKIAVLKGTTTETRLRAALQQKLVNAQVVPIAKAEEGIAMLEAGKADAYAGDKIKLVGLVTLAKDPKRFALLAEDISYEPYALALPRNDSAMRLEVNRALSKVYSDGDISAIYGKWLGRLGRPGDLLLAMYMLHSIPE